MSTTTLIWSGVGLVLLILLWRAIYWYRQSRKLGKDGYLPPHPTFVGQWTLRAVSKLFSRLYVGPIQVLGGKNACFDGRLEILPNHQFPLDFMVVGKVLPFGFRHLGSYAEMRNPLRGSLAAFAGFFAVNTEGGKATGEGGGEAVVDAMARVLVQHPQTRLLMFPQGKLVKDNILRPQDFRTGGVRAMKKACEEYGLDPNKVAYLPMAIHYLRNSRHATWLHRLMNMIGWKNFRSFKYAGDRSTNFGAIVAIGKPMTLASLPDDVREATEKIRVEIDQLLSQAKQWEVDNLK